MFKSFSIRQRVAISVHFLEEASLQFLILIIEGTREHFKNLCGSFPIFALSILFMGTLFLKLYSFAVPVTLSAVPSESRAVSITGYSRTVPVTSGGQSYSYSVTKLHN